MMEMGKVGISNLLRCDLIMKWKKFILFLGWCSIVLNCLFMLLQREQFISIVLLLFCGGLLTFLFIIEGKESLSHSLRRAISFSFDIGILYLVFSTIIECINIMNKG